MNVTIYIWKEDLENLYNYLSLPHPESHRIGFCTHPPLDIHNWVSVTIGYREFYILESWYAGDEEQTSPQSITS